MNVGDSAPTGHGVTPVLSAEGISKEFVKAGLLRRTDMVKAVADVSLKLAPGSTLGIVGESGCGKSTLSRILVGITQPTTGQVMIDGHVVSAKGTREQRERLSGIQMVFQSPAGSLDPRMRIDRIVGEPLDIHCAHLSRQEKRLLVEGMIRRVGLDLAHLARYPHELSGGQQQRVGIARALITNPKVVICDEAVSALDVSVQAQIINLLLDIQKESGIAFIFISHDLNVVAAIADEIAVMYMGRVVEQGAAQTVLSKPAHPYTSLLLDSAFVPDPRIERQRVRSVEGSATQATDRPEHGCAFRPRCHVALSKCASEAPILVRTVHGDTYVACHRNEADIVPDGTLAGEIMSRDKEE